MNEILDPAVELIRIRKRLHQERFVYWLSIGTLIIVLWLSHMGGMLYEVQLDGRPVAWTDRDTDAARALQLAQDAWRKELGATVRFQQTMKIEQSKSGGRKSMALEQAIQAVRAALLPQVAAAAILVNGEARAALPTRDQAQQALDLVRAELLGDERGLIGKPTWKEKIEIGERQLEPSRIDSSVASVRERLLGGKAASGGVVRSYIVKARDNGQTIAEAQGIPLAELKRLNPGVDFKRLKIGQRLAVKRAASVRAGRPLITLVTRRRRTFDQPVPYETREIVSASVPRGQRKVQQPGRPGRARVTEETEEENGVVVKRSETIKMNLEDPVPAVVLVGSGPAAARPPAKSAAKSSPAPPPSKARRAGAPASLTPAIVRRAPVTTRRLPVPAPPLE